MHHHKGAWNALLFGRKLWVLTPPAESSFRRSELAITSFGKLGEGWLEEASRRAAVHGNGSGGGLANSTGSGGGLANSTGNGGHTDRKGSSNRWLFCVQRAGDVLFVPHGWGHSTLNLEESIGVANFFLDEDAVGYRPSKLFHSTRGIRSLQTAAGMTSPSDFHPDGHP
jgi:hypothetical protein